MSGEINIPVPGIVVDVFEYDDGAGATIKELYVEYTDGSGPTFNVNHVHAYAYPVVVVGPDDEPPASASELSFFGNEIWGGSVTKDAPCSDAIPLPSFTVAIWEGVDVISGNTTTISWSLGDAIVIQGHCYDLLY